MIVNRPMNLNEVPFIPANLTPNDIGLLIPEGFEEHMEWELVNTSLTLKFQNSDIENAEVIIDQSIYNPEKSGTRFPNFLFEMSSLRTNKRPNYFTTHADYLLNQNQLIYLILQHRLYSFSQYKKAYAYLLARDIRAVNNFIEYLVPKAYNAVQKCNNTWVLLSVWDKILSTASKPVMKEVNGSRLIGDILSNGAYKPNDTQLPMICEDLPIHPSSESALSKTGKITVHPYEHSQLYRSVGYKQEAEGFWSIFPPKQNIVARLKTHMISDALEVAFPATSVFFQDNIPNTTTRQYERKDNCLREAIVVFQTINPTTRRFLAGEIEASTAFVDTLIYKEQSKTEQFDEVYINAGETKACDGKFVLGTRLDDTLVHLHDTDEVTCLSRRPIGILGIEKLRLKVRQAAGNARIDSNTGLKGVTKCKPNLGLITFDDPQFGTLHPDLIVGMNATKAKVNTIALAKAALAVKLGTYKPNNAWGLIDSLNEAEINAAIASLPTFVYTDEFGDVQEAHIGLAYPRFTELASTYGRFKEQSFMFETGRLMYQNGNKEFFEHIWKDYVKEETVDIIQELTKIIHDTGNEFPEDDLPHMAPLSVSKTFEQSDFVFTKVQTVPSASKLLDEEWNKGFYLNLSGVGGPIIRIPSAKVFNRMVSELPDKTWSYPAILTKVSNMLSYCFVSKETGYNRVGYIFDRSNSGRYTEHLAYGNEVTKILYTGEESGQMFVQKLLKPEVMGFAKKQVSDPLIPSNTCVIFDEKLYQKLMDHTFQDSEMPELDYLLNGLRLFFMRHPALWLTQAKNLRVWNRDDYARHLAVEHGIMINDYLDASRNKDIIFIDVDSVVRDSHADVDGDLAPLYCFKHSTDKPKLNEMIPCQEEIDWNNAYEQDEYDADKAFYEPIEYKLYFTRYTSKLVKRKKIVGYVEILINARGAKNAIGPATNDGWVFSMLIETFREFRIANQGKYEVNGKQINMPKISDADFKVMTFSYIRGLQDFVVTGVKHNDNGSAGFEMLYLKNFAKQENQKALSDIFLKTFELHPQIVAKMFAVINWAEQTGMLVACAAFLRLYNKGVTPADPDVFATLEKHKTFIQRSTFFGLLVEPIYKLLSKVETNRAQVLVDIEKSMMSYDFEDVA